jgi:hypothetical protein
MGKWTCLTAFHGGKNIFMDSAPHKDFDRSVDTANKTVTVKKTLVTPENKEVVYSARFSAVPEGVKAELAFTWPNGKEASAAIGRKPSVLMLFNGGVFQDAIIKNTAADGRVSFSAVPDKPYSNFDAPDLEDEGAKLKELTVLCPKFNTGISVAPGKDNFVYLLDMRGNGNVFRLVTEPPPGKVSLSHIIRFDNDSAAMKCKIEDITLPVNESYYFPSDKPVPVKLKVSNLGGAPLNAALKWKVETWPEKTVCTQGAKPITLEKDGKAEIRIDAKLGKRGLHRFSAEASEGGKICGSVSFPLAGIVDPLPPDRLTADSPFGIHGDVIDKTLANLGVKWIRLGRARLNWDRVEEQKGKFDWREHDLLLNNPEAENYCFLLNVSGCPAWASSLKGMTFEQMTAKYKTNPESFNTMVVSHYGGLEGMRRAFMSEALHIKAAPSDWADYRNFITEILKRYGKKITALEISNEVDGLNGFFGSPEEYTELLKQAYETAKQINPGIIIVGIAGASHFAPYSKAVMDAGGLKYMDACSFHFYVPTKYPESGAPEGAHIGETMALIKKTMEKNGKTVPVWNTEWGWAEPPKTDGFPMEESVMMKYWAEGKAGFPPSKFFSVSNYLQLLVPEEVQAKYTMRLYLISLAEGVEKFTVFGQYAFFNPSRIQVPRLSGVAQAMIAKTLTNASFAKKFKSLSPTFHGYLFKSSGGCAAALWTVAEREAVILKNAGAGAKLFDMCGNELAKNSGSDGLLLRLTDSPVYVTGITEDAEILEPVKELSVDWPFAVFAGERKTLNVSFTNNLASPLKVEISCPAPKGWAPVEKKTVTVPPGGKASADLTLQAPDTPVPGVEKLTLSLDCKAGDTEIRLASSGAFNVCAPTACAPLPEKFILNGDINKWKDRAPLKINNSKQIVWETDSLVAQFDHLWKGEDDLSARIWTGWDDKRLVVAADVKDNDVSLFKDPPGREFFGDCVELFVDGRTKSYKKDYSKGVYQILVVPPSAAGETPVVPAGTPNIGIKAAGKRTETGYFIEMEIPLTKENFPEFVPGPGAVMGFDIALDDMDKGMGEKRKIQAALNGTSLNFQDSSGFLRLRFQSQEVRANAIANGNFEEGKKNWRIKNGEIAASPGGEGKALRLNWKEKQDYAAASQDAALEPGKWYVLSMDYQAGGNTGVSFASLAIKDSRSSFRMPEYFLGGADEGKWRRAVSHVYSGPGGACGFDIILHRRGKPGSSNLKTASLTVKNIELRGLETADMRGELVENGDFEGGASGDTPPGWGVSHSGKATPPSVKTTDKDPAGGKQCMEIDVPPPQEINGLETFVGQSGAVRLEPGKKYALTFSVKSDAKEMISAAITGPATEYKRFQLTPEWTKHSMEITVPAAKEDATERKTSRLTFEGSLKRLGGAKIWIDNVSLRQAAE